MIKILIETTGNEIHGVTVSGHGGGIRGEDVVCAAVSAVTQTALTGLLFYASRCIDWKMEKEELFIRVKGCKDEKKRNIIRIILSTMSLGLKQIAREHSDRVKISLVDNPGIPDKA